MLDYSHGKSADGRSSLQQHHSCNVCCARHAARQVKLIDHVSVPFLAKTAFASQRRDKYFREKYGEDVAKAVDVRARTEFALVGNCGTDRLCVHGYERVADSHSRLRGIALHDDPSQERVLTAQETNPAKRFRKDGHHCCSL